MLVVVLLVVLLGPPELGGGEDLGHDLLAVLTRAVLGIPGGDGHRRAGCLTMQIKQQHGEARRLLQRVDIDRAVIMAERQQIEPCDGGFRRGRRMERKA